MKRIFFVLISIIFLIQTFILSAFAEGEPTKIMSLHYDNSSSLIYIAAKDSAVTQESLKYIRLTNPNRIYFDIKDAVLIGEKQQLVFEKSPIKEIRLAQFETNPDVVRAVVTLEEDVDTSNIKLLNLDGNILVKVSNPTLNSDYFNTIYNESSVLPEYSHLTVNSQFIKKVVIPTEQPENSTAKVMTDIQKAFESTTLQNTDGKEYDSLISVDLSSNLKLRTKYYINQYLVKNGGLLVSGLGQMTTAKTFCLTSPNRLVVDLPNTFLDKSIRNKELNLCSDNSCNDTAKIGQFEHNIARIVITSDNAEKYIPIYSNDSQSLFLINSEKLNHTSLVSSVANLNRAFIRRVSPEVNELILSFTNPVVHSILREGDRLNFYLFNVKSYNEQDLLKTLNNTMYSSMTFSLLPQIGIKASLPNIDAKDIISVDQSVDGKALKIKIKKSQPHSVKPVPIWSSKKEITKNKIVLDAGHGGTDYGAIREGINEKDITLDVMQRVDAILRAKGYSTALTRSDDTFVSLEDRVAFSEKEEPEIFISIHVNSAVSKDPNGLETHYYHDYSKELASVVHEHLTKALPSKDRGLFKSKFYVINHTTVPAILVEIGFLSNDDERQELITDSRKQKTAKAIAEGIIDYLKMKDRKRK